MKLTGNTVSAGSSNGWVSFDPYYEITYQMATFNGTGNTNFAQSEAPFNGLLSTRVVTDLGKFSAYFPSPYSDEVNSQNEKRDKNKISIGADNILYDSPGYGGQIAVGTYVKFGLKVDIFLFSTLFKFTIGAPDMSLWYNTMTVFSFYPDEAKQTACTEYDVITNIYSDITDSSTVNWDDEHVQLAYDRQAPSDGNVCYPIAGSSSKRRRSMSLPTRPPEPKDTNSTQLPPRDDLTELLTHPTQRHDAPAHANEIKSRSDVLGDLSTFVGKRQTGSIPIDGWGYNPGLGVDPNNYFGEMDYVFDKSEPKFKCSNCEDCAEDDSNLGRCCGCASMDYRWPDYSDIPDCESCNPDDTNSGSWPGGIFLKKKDELSSQLLGISNKTKLGLFDEHGELVQGDIDDEEDDLYHLLDERAAGDPNTGYKKVKVCGTRYW